MKRLVRVGIMIIAGIFLVTSCGGGGGGGEKVTPPTVNLTGTYNLIGFDVDYYDGGGFYVGSIDETDFSSWSGVMKVGVTTISQSLTLESDVMGVSGTYVVTYTNGTAVGYFTVNVGGQIDNVGFAIDGNIMTTYAEGYVSAYGWDYGEWDYWRKVSDSVSLSAVNLSIEPDSENSFGFAGLIELENFL